MPKKSLIQQEYVESVIRTHLLPRFQKMLVGEITELEVFRFWEDNRNKPESTLKKHLRLLKEIIQLADKTFELPKLIFCHFI